VSQERAASTAERESKSKKSPVVKTASLRARRMRRAMREGVLDCWMGLAIISEICARFSELIKVF
jgi:hypothetical protein